MFTGDASGRFLFKALFDLGLANQPDGAESNDGLELNGVYITAVGRCAPPQNKPTPEELRTCMPFAVKEMLLLKNLKVIVALGKIAHDHYVRHAGGKLSQYVFKHGAVHNFSGYPELVDIYHPSRQNTQTGLLTMPMFKEALSKAKSLAGL